MSFMNGIWNTVRGAGKAPVLAGTAAPPAQARERNERGRFAPTAVPLTPAQPLGEPPAKRRFTQEDSLRLLNCKQAKKSTKHDKAATARGGRARKRRHSQVTAQAAEWVGPVGKGVPLTEQQAAMVCAAYMAYDSDGKLRIPASAASMEDRVRAACVLTGRDTRTVRKAMESLVHNGNPMYETEKRGTGSPKYPHVPEVTEEVRTALRKFVVDALDTATPTYTSRLSARLLLLERFGLNLSSKSVGEYPPAASNLILHVLRPTAVLHAGALMNDMGLGYVHVKQNTLGVPTQGRLYARRYFVMQLHWALEHGYECWTTRRTTCAARRSWARALTAGSTP